VRAGHDAPVELAEDRMEVLVGPEIRLFPPMPPRTGEDLIVSDTAAAPSHATPFHATPGSLK
jgi:hypothetical protein